jgi:glycerol-3-phosphate O-acyltransferase
MKTEELKNVVDALRELGSSYGETLSAMSGVVKELRSASRLWRKGDKSKLIRLGLTLVAFPEPTPISETLGAVVLSVGIIQTKMRQSALHIEDIYATFQEEMWNLQAIKLAAAGRSTDF